MGLRCFEVQLSYPKWIRHCIEIIGWCPIEHVNAQHKESVPTRNVTMLAENVFAPTSNRSGQAEKPQLWRGVNTHLPSVHAQSDQSVPIYTRPYSWVPVRAHRD